MISSNLTASLPCSSGVSFIGLAISCMFMCLQNYNKFLINKDFGENFYLSTSGVGRRERTGMALSVSSWSQRS